MSIFTGLTELHNHQHSHSENILSPKEKTVCPGAVSPLPSPSPLVLPLLDISCMRHRVTSGISHVMLVGFPCPCPPQLAAPPQPGGTALSGVLPLGGHEVTSVVRVMGIMQVGASTSAFVFSRLGYHYLGVGCLGRRATLWPLEHLPGGFPRHRNPFTHPHTLFLT